MSSKTPFELRFEIFQKASEMLEYEYNMKRDHAMMKYDWETTAGKTPEVPAMEQYPTFTEISEYASRINDFVSNSK
jgi:hypothetical protein